MVINESLLKLEVADPPSPRSRQGGARSSPVWDRVRAFADGHPGAWCRVLEVPLPAGADVLRVQRLQSELANRVKARMAAERYECATRREGDVLRAYVRTRA